MVWKLIFVRILQAKSSLIIIFIDIKTIEWSYLSNIITISLKKIRKMVLDQVATFSLQPEADVCRARLQQRS